MFGMLPVVLALLLAAGVAWSLRPVRTVGPVSPSEAWIAAERHARRVAAAAWFALVGVLVLVAFGFESMLSGPSRGAVLGALPGLAGVAFLVVLAAGELTWPRPTGAVRRAPLVPRRIRDLAPHALSAVTALWAGLLALLLIACGVAAGHDGRSLSYSRAEGFSSTVSPFPGGYFGRAIGPVILVLLVGAVAVLALIARRAAVSDTTEAADASLRRTSARRVLAGVQLVVAWTLAGCLYFAASALGNVQPRWADAFGPGTARSVAVVGAVLALVIPIVATVVAVRGSRALATPPAPAQRAETYRKTAGQPQASA